MASESQNKEQAGLGLFDAVSIIVGIVIGTTIFKVPWLIFDNSSDPVMGLSVWLLGGVLAFIGAMCYAELATTYPRTGGDYYYLTRSFGPCTGFLFGWAQLAVVFTASIGAMAFVFGEFATEFEDLGKHFDLKEFNEQIGSVGIHSEFIYASLAVIVLTFLNLLGVLMGKLTQNLLTVVKIASVLAIIVAGFGWPKSLPTDSPSEWRLANNRPNEFAGEGGEDKNKPYAFENPYWDLTIARKENNGLQFVFTNRSTVRQRIDFKLSLRTSKDEKAEPEVFELKSDTVEPSDEEKKSSKTFDFPPKTGQERATVSSPAIVPRSIGWQALALILVLYAFGGWNDAAFVASEVREPQRNIPRALLIGVGLITVVYLLVNAAYISGLGWVEASSFGRLPAKLLENVHRDWGGKAMSILVMISALGAVNGLTFTGARIYATLGSDYALFSWMGHWKPGKRAPILALLVQALATLSMIFMLGTEQGHNWINVLLNLANIPHDPEWKSGDAFEKLVSHTAPVFWIFFLLTGASLFRLRTIDAGLARPFSVPLYPWLPLIFCNTCIFMLYSSVVYVGWRSLFAIALTLLGIPLYLFACLIGGYRGDATK